MDPLIHSRLQDTFDDVKTKSLELKVAPLKDRKSKLKALESWILKHRADIQQALYKDLQKPPTESDLTEIYVVLSEIRLARKKLRTWATRKPIDSNLVYLGTKAHVFHEPKGACLIISPWNYPFQLTMAPLVSAIAAGNSVIIKPSEYSEHTSDLIQRLCSEVFNKEEVAAVLGAVEMSTELLKFPFDHVFFTGSPQVGKIVMEAAAKNLASVTLELGGKSPTIVDDTAAIKDAAKKIAWAKWQNAGQVCIAPDYLFVHEDIKERLVDEISLQTEKIYGNPEDYGGIINKKHYSRINDLMVDAINKGASLEFGGKTDSKNLRFTPTAIGDVARNSQILEEEIFGPILPILTYRELDQVIEFINSKPKPLALYLFSRSRKNMDLIEKRTSSGMMTINDAVLQFGHPYLPIGGVNNSGIGKSHGHAGFIAFTNEKAVLKQRIGLTVIKFVYPPYSKIKKLIVDFMIRFM